MTLAELTRAVCCLKKSIGTEAALSAIPSSGVLRVAAAVQDGETVTIGNQTYEVVSDGGAVSGDNLPVDLTGSVTADKATSTLTASGNASTTEIVTIGTTVYQIIATPAAAYDVQLGASAADTLANLAAAIMANGTPGTEYFAGTLAHPDVIVTAFDATTIDVEAKVAGTAANTIDTTTTVSDFAWTGTDLAGGVDPTAAEFTTAFTAAVNSYGGPVDAFRANANAVIVTDDQGRTLGTTETLAGSNNVWGAATLLGGTTGSGVETVVVSRVANATEDALELMVFTFSFAPSAASVQVRTTAGVAKAWDGAVTISGNNVVLTSSGSTDIDATDVVTVTAA